MHLKLTRSSWLSFIKPTSASSVAKQLGVDESRLHVSPGARLSTGARAAVSADVFNDAHAHVTRPSLGSAQPGEGVASFQPLRSPRFGSLEGLALLEFANRFVDKGDVSVKAPLTPGVHSLPLGTQQVQIRVSPGTELTLAVSLAPGMRSLDLASVDLAFSRPVTVLNPAELSVAGKSLIAEIANDLLSVKLEGLAVDRHGNVTPRGSIERPSFNPLKHLFSTGRSETALASLASLVGTPRVSTSLEQLSQGNVLRERPALAAADLPLHVELEPLVRSLGGVVERGSFSMRLEGRAGFVEAGRGVLKITGVDRRLSATLSGDFEARDKALHVQASAATSLPLSTRVRFDDDGAPEVVAGALRVSSSVDAFNIFSSGALLGSIRAGLDAARLSVPEDVHLTFDGQALIHAQAVIRPTARGLVVENGGAQVAIDVAHARATANTLEVELGPGARIELAATGISTSTDDLVIEHAQGQYSATAHGFAQRGLFHVALDGTESSGRFSLTPHGATAVARYSLKARPKLGPLTLPLEARVEGEGRVVLTSSAVLVETVNDTSLGLSRPGMGSAPSGR